MILTGLDTETTGLNPADGHRIIEICFRHYDSETKELLDSYVQRIKPNRPIDPKAQAVHGISVDDLIKCPTFEEIAEEIAGHMAKADYLVAHNMDFDANFLVTELANAGVDIPDVETFCTMENARWATPYGKKPNLGELCYALDVPYDAAEAHAADYDVDVMMQCLFNGINLNFYTLKQTVAKSEEKAA